MFGFTFVPLAISSLPRQSTLPALKKGIASQKKARGIEAAIVMAAAVAVAAAAGIGRVETLAAVILLEKPAIGMAVAAVGEAGGGARPP